MKPDAKTFRVGRLTQTKTLHINQLCPPQGYRNARADHQLVVTSMSVIITEAGIGEEGSNNVQ